MHFIKDISVSTRMSIVFTLFLVSFCGVAQPNLHELIQEQTKDYVLNTLINDADADTQVSVRQLDARITVPKCAQAFEFESPNYDPRLSNISVKVSCPHLNWFTFVNASVVTIQKVVVSADTLSPGALLTSQNIALADVSKNSLRGSAFRSVEEISGARLKRRVRPGTVINASMLCFVCKGDRVTISAIAGGLSIQVYGIAEQDGTLGDTIAVRNISSDKRIVATVASTDRVTINI
ncbi:flagellar basal body P-ring formation chaperone FlgA [Ningiella sp. W23]|uniref:flagellar basal body P-ring formation chaperone FlgA n=1 Tax=Ningiella sp. W23 TaxID=3023715 RepID=UPI00375787F7